MDLLTQIKQRFTSNTSVHRTIGLDYINGNILCGFIKKPESSKSDINITFDFYGSLLVLEGTGKYIDSNGFTTDLYPGCFVQRIPGLKHSTLVTSKNWQEAYVCFGRNIYFSLEQLGLISSNKPVIEPGLNYNLLQKIVNLYDKLVSASVHQLPVLITNSQEIVLLAHELDTIKNHGQSLSQMELACKLLEQSPEYATSLQTLSKELGMSYEHFRKVFKDKIGISPHTYLITRRIDRAKALLQNSEKSIAEIASELGYNDYFSFTRQFRKYTGKSPSDFRKQF